jgi:hypothetical protein
MHGGPNGLNQNFPNANYKFLGCTPCGCDR